MDKQIITRKIKNFLIAERGMDMVGVCPASALDAEPEGVEVQDFTPFDYSSVRSDPADDFQDGEPARSPRPSRYDEEQVSPIFERRARSERPPREGSDTGYEQREQRRAERQQTRRPRVYQDEGPEPRSQNRRGFTPDVPSFMKRK